VRERRHSTGDEGSKSELEKYRKNYHTFLTSQAIMQDITKDGARSYAA
jgi:hypothetical protein